MSVDGYPWSILNGHHWHLDQHPVDVFINTQSTVDWQLVDSQHFFTDMPLSVDRWVTWLTINQLTIKCQSRCWLSVNLVSIKCIDWHLTPDAFCTHDLNSEDLLALLTFFLLTCTLPVKESKQCRYFWQHYTLWWST